MGYKDYEGDKDNSSTELNWNFEGAEAMLLFQIKLEYKNLLNDWDLDKCYFKARELSIECKTLLTDEEQEEVNTQLTSLEVKRKDQYKDRKITKEEQGEYYLALEKLYGTFNNYFREHGLCFRTKEDTEGL